MKLIANCTIHLATVVAALAIGAAPAAQAADRCSAATLKGSFGGLLTGTIIGYGPFAMATTVTFDGTGGWFYDESGNINGTPAPTQHYTGTYTVAANCSGSTKDSGGNSTDFVIVGSAKAIEVMMVGTGTGAVFTVVLKQRVNTDN